MHPVPYQVNSSFVIFNILALWRSALSVRVPRYQKLPMLAYSVWHRMFYSCTHMATVDVKCLMDYYKSWSHWTGLIAMSRDTCIFACATAEVVIICWPSVFPWIHHVVVSLLLSFANFAAIIVSLVSYFSNTTAIGGLNSRWRQKGGKWWPIPPSPPPRVSEPLGFQGNIYYYY